MSNKFKKRLKKSPLFTVETTTTVNKNTAKVVFHYLNEQDALDNHEMCIGSEFEHYLPCLRETIQKLREPILDAGCYGKLKGYNPFVPENHSEEFDLPGSLTTDASNRSALLNVYLKLVQANMTSTLFSPPILDKTVGKESGGKGGPEIVFAPISEAGLKLLKPEIARVLLYAKMFDAEDVADSSIHFHISRKMFGGNKEEFKETFQNMLWFYWENQDFIRDFSGRMGTGKDLADMLVFIGDPYNRLSKEEQKIRFMMKKGLNLQMFMEEDVVDRKMSADSQIADDRIKGFFNMVIGDEFDTVEVRFDGSTRDTEVYMSKYEFQFALVNMCKIAGIHASHGAKSLQSFVSFVADRRMRYPHLWNRLLTDRYCEEYIKDEEGYDDGPLYTDQYSAEELINFNYDIPTIQKHFVADEKPEEGPNTEDPEKAKIISGILDALKVNLVGESEPIVEAVTEDIKDPVILEAAIPVYECSISGFESTDKRLFYSTYNTNEYTFDEVAEDESLLMWTSKEIYDGLDWEAKEDLKIYSQCCDRCSKEVFADEDGDMGELNFFHEEELCYDCWEAAIEADETETEEEEELSSIF